MNLCQVPHNPHPTCRRRKPWLICAALACILAVGCAGRPSDRQQGPAAAAAQPVLARLNRCNKSVKRSSAVQLTQLAQSGDAHNGLTSLSHPGLHRQLAMIALRQDVRQPDRPDPAPTQPWSAARLTNQAGALLGQQQADLLQNLLRHCVWQGADELHRAGLPIQALDLIRQNDATHG